MPKLACRCGYVHNLSPIPDDGYQVLPDWATDKLLYTDETQPEDWEIDHLRQSALSRLYVCPNCEAIVWDRAGDGHFVTYLQAEGLIRVFVDLSDRDPLGGIRLCHPRTLADIQRQRLLLRSGVWIVVHDDVDEIDAHVEQELDDNDKAIVDAWVARPHAA
jgi:hypothetical protein